MLPRTELPDRGDVALECGLGLAVGVGGMGSARELLGQPLVALEVRGETGAERTVVVVL